MTRTIHGLPGIYNSSPISLSDGEGAALALNSDGTLKLSADVEIGAVELKDGTTDTRSTINAANTARTTATTTLVVQHIDAAANVGGVQGQVASGATDSGNPVKIGGKYNASAPTLTDGQRGDLQLDVNGNTKVYEQYAPAAEDNVAQVIKVEQRFSYAYTGTAPLTADIAIKSGAGFVHSITISQGDVAPTAGTITLYDNTAESGVVIFQEYVTTGVFSAHTVMLNCTFGTGLYLGFNGPADVNVAVTYR